MLHPSSSRRQMPKVGLMTWCFRFKHAGKPESWPVFVVFKLQQEVLHRHDDRPCYLVCSCRTIRAAGIWYRVQSTHRYFWQYDPWESHHTIRNDPHRLLIRIPITNYDTLNWRTAWYSKQNKGFWFCTKCEYCTGTGYGFLIFHVVRHTPVGHFPLSMPTLPVYIRHSVYTTLLQSVVHIPYPRSLSLNAVRTWQHYK